MPLYKICILPTDMTSPRSPNISEENNSLIHHRKVSSVVTQHSKLVSSWPSLLHNVAKRWGNTETQLRQEVFACILPFLKCCFKVELVLFYEIYNYITLTHLSDNNQYNISFNCWTKQAIFVNNVQLLHNGHILANKQNARDDKTFSKCHVTCRCLAPFTIVCSFIWSQ